MNATMRSVFACLLGLVAIPAVAQKSDCLQQSHRIAVLQFDDFPFEEIVKEGKVRGDSFFRWHRRVPSPHELAERLSTVCEFWIVSELCLFTPAHITVLRRFVDAGGHPAFLRRQPNPDGTPHFMVRDAESWLESLPPEPPPPDVANNLRQEDMVDALRRSNAELVACVRGQPTSQTSRRLLSLTIEPSGRVSSASLVSGVPTAPEAAACLKELGRALQFPARAIPRTTVAFPISF